MKTIILGGGLTGLTLAYLMGQNVEILEKEPECGGLMRTIEYEGFTFDWEGSHVIFSKNPEPLNFMLSLLGKNKVRNRRNTKILYNSRLVKYPFENGLSDLPKRENFQCLYDFIQSTIKKEKGEISKPVNLKEWFIYTFGEAIALKYLVPYNEKIWKYPIDQMSLEWVERVPSPPIADVIKSSLGITTEGYTHQLYFYYPRHGGIQSLIKSLETRIAGSVTTNFEVIEVSGEDGNWIISNGRQKKRCEKLVSTIPIQRLVKAIDAPSKIREAANRLKYNSLITVMIGLKKKLSGNLSWLYIPNCNILPHRVSFPSNYSPDVTPVGMSSVVAEITCKVEDEVWQKKDSIIANQVVNDLHSLNIIDKLDVSFALTRRAEYAYVISDLNYKENMKIIRDYFTQKKIGLVGRFSEFRYLNMDDCVKSAMNYVEKN
ncbi:MAG: FAD-dependent oxidoreductase [Candidatus Bathyarchaeota archaeon]|nr:FAD-dependent oxidoreductase [Candidatus Bathyarchaeota archaeon]